MEFLKNYRQGRGRSGQPIWAKRTAARRSSAASAAFIRCQEKAAEKEYLALGRYYYHNLRDKENDCHRGPLRWPWMRLSSALDAALDQLSQCYSAGEAREEVTLEDVQAFDQDPAAQEETPAQAAPDPGGGSPRGGGPRRHARPGGEENENLPFEG